jgi:hypothetical protein
MVAAPPLFGHWSLLRRHVLRRRTPANYGIELHATRGCKKDIQRCEVSPGSRGCAQTGRWLPESSARSRIPARCCERERRNHGSRDFLFPIPLFLMILLVVRSSQTNRGSSRWLETTSTCKAPATDSGAIWRAEKGREIGRWLRRKRATRRFSR